MDDTLYDEIDYCRSGFTSTAMYITENCASAEQLKTEKVFNALWSQFTAGNTKTTFNAALDKLGIRYDDSLIRKLVEVYRTHPPSIQLPGESKSTLDKLHDDYTLAMLTDGFLPAQELKVKALGIEKYFKMIVFTEKLGREFWKPSPVGFEKILNNLKESAENCIYVGDNAEKDFIAPNELGMVTIQLIRAKKIHKSPPPSQKAAPKYKIADISALESLLTEL